MNLILIRGLPGSGKTTLAHQLVKGFGRVHLEADQFFMHNGVYEFDANNLGTAHSWCQQETRRLLKSGMTVIVSNTFTTIRELRSYFNIAAEFDIVPQVIVCQNQFVNVHNVPAETMERMRTRWQWDISQLFMENERAKIN